MLARRSGRTLLIRTLLAAAPALGLMVVASQPSVASPTTATATITILHGLPNFTADVYVNGKLTLDGFKPETATGALSLPAGSYDVAIRNVGDDPNSTPVLEATITLRAGSNYSAIAHLSGDGSPALDLFENDLSKIPAGKSRLVARNLAQSPPLDLRLDGKVVFKGLAPGGSSVVNRTASSHMLDAVDASDGAQLVPATRLQLHEGTQTIVYVVGSASDQSMDFMVQDIRGLSSDPNGVFAGSGGLAAPQGFPAWAVGLMAFLAGVAACSLVALRMGTRR